MLPSIFEEKKKNFFFSNRTKSLLIVNLILSAKNEFCGGKAFCYLTLPVFQQCHKPRFNSLKFVFDL